MDDIEIDLAAAPMTADDGTIITAMPDGSVEVDLEGRGEEESRNVLDEDNLAEKMPDHELARVGQQLCELIDKDEESRAAWLERFKAGLEMIALTGSGPKPGMEKGSDVIHPLISEAAVQFQARALAELFPLSGPVKGGVLGPQTKELLERASRVEQHMNWQMVEEDEEYFDHVDQLLLVLPLAGSDFKKTAWDPLDDKLTGRRVGAEDVIVPYKAKSLAKARRVTHRFWLDQTGMAELQESGFYLDNRRLRLQQPNEMGEQTVADDADAATSSFDPDEDGEYQLLECSTFMDFGEGVRPYLVTIERESQRVASIRRFWRERNGRIVRRSAFTHYKYLPGLGFYGFGLFHVIGGLQKAATDSLRGFMDAASFANWRGGFKTKEAKVAGQTLTLQYGVWKDVDLTAEEMQKGFYTPDFKEPSPAQVTILERVEMLGQRFASTTEANVPESNENTPVGTTIARIEEAGKVRSSIHRRLHMAAKAEFRLRAELNFDHMDDAGQEVVSASTNIVIAREDYDPNLIDVVPVSDPNITSTPQRIALAQATLEAARADPVNLSVVEAERRYLEALKVPDIDQIMVDPNAIPAMDPISEGSKAMTGGALKVYPEQNHAAHIQVHMALLAQIKGSPAEKVAGPILLSHVNAHMAAQYRIDMSQKLGVPIPDPAIPQEEPMPPQIQEAIGMAAAEMIAQSGVTEGQAQPDPESALKMAQAEKTRAETDEVRARTTQARVDLLGEEEQIDPQAILAEVKAMIDQAIKPLGQQLLDTRAELEETLAARDEEAERSRIESAADGKVREAEGKVKETEGRTEAEMVRASMQSQIDELDRTVARLEKDLEKALEADDEDEGEDKAEKPEAQPIVVNVGPIHVDAKSGPKSMTLKRGPDGKVTGADVADAKDDS